MISNISSIIANLSLPNIATDYWNWVNTVLLLSVFSKTFSLILLNSFTSTSSHSFFNPSLKGINILEQIIYINKIIWKSELICLIFVFITVFSFCILLKEYLYSCFQKYCYLCFDLWILRSNQHIKKLLYLFNFKDFICEFLKSSVNW